MLLALMLLMQTSTPGQLRTGVVTGILRTNTGSPLEGVRVAVTPADAAVADDLLESIGLTDKDGRFRLENISPGRYHIVIGRGFSRSYHPGVSDPQSATVVVITAGAAVTVPDVIFGRVKVSGRVMDWATGQGRRIQSLKICCEYALSQTGSFGAVSTSGAAFATSVKDDGTFVFDDVPRGKFTIQASDPGIIATGQALSVSDVDVNGLEVRVSNGVRVQGDVFDRFGNPAPGVVARLTSRPTNTAFAIATNALIAAGGVVAVVSGPFSSPSIDALQAALMRSVKPEFVPTATDGRFTIDRLLPGRYLLEVNSPGRNLLEREIEVGPQGVENLRVELPFTQVVGRVVPGGGEPLPKLDGSIRLIPPAPGSQILYVFPEADGRFFMLLAPGEYRISTMNLGRSVQSITDGTRDLAREPLVFDGVRRPDILITLEP
jgi:hypothetical protein